MKHLFTLYMVLILGSSVELFAQKTVYIPNDWVQRKIPYSMARSAQSANFVVFWGEKAGLDPRVATPADIRFNPQTVLDTLESIYDFYINQLEVIPKQGLLNQYKMIIVMNETWNPLNGADLFTGWAYGGGYDDKVGAMWVHPNSMRDNGWVISHEFGHVMQNYTSILTGRQVYRNNHSGSFWETHANFIALQRYPSFTTATDIPRAINLSHYSISNPRKHYGSWHYLQHFKDEFGMEFINNIWMQAQTGDHPLQTVKRLKGWTQEQLNDNLGQWAMKQAKYDYKDGGHLKKGAASLPSEWVWRPTIVLDAVSEGHYAVPKNLAPQDYGYNIVRLHLTTPQNCNEPYVRLRFKGHIDTNASSGWRYGFVTVNAAGTITYSNLMKDDTETIFRVGQGVTELYLVVMGAPTVHHNYAEFEVGFPRMYRYPYEIKLEGAVPEGYQPGYRKVAGVSGSAHPNGGGFVASTATVSSTAFIGPNAQVLGNAQVSGNSRIEGYAIVQDQARVSGTAVVSGSSLVARTSIVSGNARISKGAQLYDGNHISQNAVITDNAVLFHMNVSGNALIKDNVFNMWATFSGTTILGGDAEIGGTCSAGTYLQVSGVGGRGGCDGITNHITNQDINAVYIPFTASQMAFQQQANCGVLTGIKDDLNEKKVLLAVSPNPASLSFTVTYPALKAGQLLLKDLSGKTVREMKLPSGTQSSVSTDIIAPGIYFIQVSTPEGLLYKSKVIIQQ